MPKKSSRSIARIYARYFTPVELKSLRATPPHDQTSEINLLRVLAARFMEFQQTAPKDVESQMQALHTLSILGREIARLSSAHNREHDPLDESARGILEAIASLNPYEEL